MLTFRITSHAIKSGVSIVEILLNGQVVGVMYPEGDKGIKIVSAHFKGVGVEGQTIQEHVSIDNATGALLPIPAISLLFEPGPYRVEGGKIVRIKPENN